MKRALTYNSFKPGVLARVPSGCRRRFLGPAGPLLDAISLRVAPGLLGTQFVLVATAG